VIWNGRAAPTFFAADALATALYSLSLGVAAPVLLPLFAPRDFFAAPFFALFVLVAMVVLVGSPTPAS